MATPSAYLEPRSSHWLLAADAELFAEWLEQRVDDLARLKQTIAAPLVLVAEPEPVRFLASLMAACVAECPVCLGNPTWGRGEWQQVLQVLRPDRVWGVQLPDGPACQPVSLEPGWILIPTGGSSGQLRFAVHTWETLMASVQGFQQHFAQETIHSCCVLPLYHVSGLMQFLRSFTSGGTLAVASWRSIEAGDLPNLDPSGFFLSLVPTQLQRLLRSPQSTHWLSQFQTVLLGGAPAWAELLDQARAAQIRLALTYGMTETASQVATLLPEEFLQGHNHCGRVLPQAAIAIAAPPGEIGQIQIQGRSLALGYLSTQPLLEHATRLVEFGVRDGVRSLQTDDLGFLDTGGGLHVVGRSSQKIITGGENVFPVEVESALRATGLVLDVCVVGTPDPVWGQSVTAIYVPAQPWLSIESLQTALQGQLSTFKHPKRWIAVDQLPRNAQGKLDWVGLQRTIDCSTPPLSRGHCCS